MHIILIYIGVFLGVLMEGELVMLSSVIAAHHHYVNIWVVLVMGISATLFQDLLYFNLGRQQGMKWLNRKPARQKKFETVDKRIRKYPVLIFLIYRFAWGFRAITPFVIGTSQTKSSTFYMFSVGTTLLWAAVYGSVGYMFGELIQSKLSHIEHIEKYIIGSLAFLAIILILIRKLIKKNA
jgi:membrane protein DedA with SNARE-associated domain